MQPNVLERHSKTYKIENTQIRKKEKNQLQSNRGQKRQNCKVVYYTILNILTKILNKYNASNDKHIGETGSTIVVASRTFGLTHLSGLD